MCSLFGLAGYANEVMDRELLVPYRRTEFEGHLLPVPCKEKGYLEKLYGDYEVLPPKEDREPKHDGYLRFVEAMKSHKGE